jgi:hypothetical protein
MQADAEALIDFRQLHLIRRQPPRSVQENSILLR